MQISVIGLGIEGRKAIDSLKSRQYEVYASDLNKNINLNCDNHIDIDLGFHDFDKIEKSDAIILSPSLWHIKKFEKFKLENKLLSDIFTKHKDIYTIVVTGTNGKTTTTNMIYNILKKSGLNILVGGNAGGGFNGYSELILKSQEQNYDILLIEVCDMTLEYCDYTFDIDLVVLTNMEEDHMDVHKTMDNYYYKIINFIKNKTAVINKEYQKVIPLDKNITYYGKYDGDLTLKGEFNKFNASAAYTACNLLNIDLNLIKESLSTFDGVEGRSKYYYINNCELLVGKTDNAHATKVALSETYFEVVFLGTPRENEIWRLDLFKEAINSKPKTIIIFPGLTNNVDNIYKKVLTINNNNIEIIKVNDFDDLFNLIKEMTYNSKTIFIGGNGQDKIIKIQKMLDKYCMRHDYCE